MPIPARRRKRKKEKGKEEEGQIERRPEIAKMEKGKRQSGYTVVAGISACLAVPCQTDVTVFSLGSRSIDDGLATSVTRCLSNTAMISDA